MLIFVLLCQIFSANCNEGCECTEADQCTSCVDGYYESTTAAEEPARTASKTCSKCPSGCATCESNKKCLTCDTNNGFTLDSTEGSGTKDLCICDTSKHLVLDTAEGPTKGQCICDSSKNFILDESEGEQKEIFFFL